MGERLTTVIIVMAAVAGLLMVDAGGCSDGRSPDIETQQSPA